MKALTVWQPWASLIMLGAKRYEFRRWDYRKRDRSLVGQRIVIHAGSRPIKRDEILDIAARLQAGDSALDPEIAGRVITRLLDAHKCQGVLELAAGLGTAVLERPRLASKIFTGPKFDSDRIDQSVWAWPLADIQTFAEPVPMRGYQGFWNWPELEPTKSDQHGG